MIGVEKEIIKLEDIQYVNDSEKIKDLTDIDCFTTDGKYLYYRENFEDLICIRGLSNDEQFLNIISIVKSFNFLMDINNNKKYINSVKDLMDWIIEKCCDTDIQNIGDNEFKNEIEVFEFWYNTHHSYKYIYEVYDEYYGISELILEY